MVSGKGDVELAKMSPLMSQEKDEYQLFEQIQVSNDSKIAYLVIRAWFQFDFSVTVNLKNYESRSVCETVQSFRLASLFSSKIQHIFFPFLPKGAENQMLCVFNSLLIGPWWPRKLTRLALLLYQLSLHRLKIIMNLNHQHSSYLFKLS